VRQALVLRKRANRSRSPTTQKYGDDELWDWPEPNGRDCFIYPVRPSRLLRRETTKLCNRPQVRNAGNREQVHGKAVLREHVQVPCLVSEYEVCGFGPCLRDTVPLRASSRERVSDRAAQNTLTLYRSATERIPGKTIHRCRA